MSIRKIFSKEIRLGLNGKLMAMAIFLIFDISFALVYYMRFEKVTALPIFLAIIFSLMIFQAAKEKAKGRK